MPIPALIGAGAAAFGAALSSHSTNKTNETNMQIAKMNNEFNERMMERQMEYNTEMWNKQNEYNSASSQVERYREAGLNPFLMMNGQSAGTAQAAGGINPPTADQSGRQIPHNFDFSGIGNAVGQYYQRQVDIANIRKVLSEAEGNEIDNLTRYQMNKAQLMDLYSTTRDRNVRLELEKMTRAMDMQMMNADFRKRMTETQLLEQQIEGQYLDNIAKSIQNEHMPAIMKMNIAQASASIMAQVAAAKLSEKQAEHEIQKTIETQHRAFGLKIDNYVKNRTAKSIIKQAKNDAYWSQYTDNKIKLGQSAYSGYVNRPRKKFSQQNHRISSAFVGR